LGAGESLSASADPDPLLRLLPLLERLALLCPALFPLRVPALFLAFAPLAEPVTFFWVLGPGVVFPP
jgi:hypothetical protein